MRRPISGNMPNVEARYIHLTMNWDPCLARMGEDRKKPRKGASGPQAKDKELRGCNEEAETLFCQWLVMTSKK